MNVASFLRKCNETVFLITFFFDIRIRYCMFAFNARFYISFCARVCVYILIYSNMYI